jgi:hypothetical protein
MLQVGLFTSGAAVSPLGEGLRRGLVKRVTAFCKAATVLGKGPENACGETRFPCVLKHARDSGHVRVYCTGLLRTGLLSYVSRTVRG